MKNSVAIIGRTFLLGLIALLLSCSGRPPEPKVPLTEPTRLCGGALKNACRSAAEIESYFADPRLTLLGAVSTHRGIQGAKIVTLEVPTGSAPVIFRAKWRPVSATEAHTIPRRELAAYEVQKLVLRPEEYVVPPTGGHCFDLAKYRELVDAEATETFPGLSCVFGYLSFWLEDVKSLHSVPGDWYQPSRGPLDEKLLESNPDYRRSIARTNLLTYLIDHDDSHWKQFLVRANPAALVVFSVDNSMSFDAGTNPKIGKEDDWSRFQVPLYPELIERVRAIDESRLRKLRAIEQYEVRRGQLVRATVQPSLWSPAADAPVQWNCGVLRVGLAAREVDFLRVRIGTLIDAFARHEARELEKEGHGKRARL